MKEVNKKNWNDIRAIVGDIELPVFQLMDYYIVVHKEEIKRIDPILIRMILDIETRLTKMESERNDLP